MAPDKPVSTPTPTAPTTSQPSGGGATTPTSSPTSQPAKPAEVPKPKPFHGTVTPDPQRAGRDAGRIAEEIIAHLSSLIGAEGTVRLVPENCRTLKFESQGLESE